MEGTVRDYMVLDEANLLVTASARRRYHLTLAQRSFGLRSAQQIGFKSATSRICEGFGSVVIDDNFGLESIRIAAMRRLTPEEYDQILIRFGKKEPEIEQTPAEKPVEGAEVEELD